MNNSRKQTPLNSAEYAWRVAIHPSEFSKSDRKLLFKRAITEHYKNDDETINQDKLLSDVASFVSTALDRPTQESVATDPPELIHTPAKAAVMMALGSVLVRRHNVIDSDPRNAKIHEYVREYYRYIIFAAAKHGVCNGVVQTEIGTVVYSRKQEDTYGPPPGKTISDVTKLPGFDTPFYEIPLVHANRYCISRDEDSETPRGNLTCIVDGPYVYIPISDARKKYKHEFTKRDGVAHLLEQMVYLSIGDNRLDAYQQSMTGLNTRIEELHSQGHDDMLFEEREYPAKLEAILRAIDNADTETAAIGDSLTSKEVYSIAQKYASETNVNWVRNVLDALDSPKSIGQTLTQYANNDDIQHVTVEKRSGAANKYTFEYSVGGVKKIEVKEIEDLLELPCMENLHESLQDGKPVRWELYSFVRYVFEIHTTEFTVEDIKEWFSQYPWYREDVTEYQAQYEKEQRMSDGNRPLPISCRNDNDSWAKHCIGIENCDYSLYRSVELSPDVYDRISDNDTSNI